MSTTNGKTRQQLLEERMQLSKMLEEEKEKVETAIRAEQQERIEAIQAMVAQLESEGVVIKLLLDGRAVKQASKATSKDAATGPQRGVRAPKWRDPETGATWSGIGPSPKWYGRAVDIATGAPAHPPKYRDPISGAVWNGYGMEPSWFARAVPYEPPQPLHGQRGGLDVLDDDAE